MLQKLYQKVPELEKSTAVAVEKMRLEESARRKLEERLITVSHQPKDSTGSVLCITCNHASTVLTCVYANCGSILPALHSMFMKQQPHGLTTLKQPGPSIGVWCKSCGRASSVTWLFAVQTKTALSRMTREHDNVTAQLTQAEQVKLVAEGELAEVRLFTCPSYLNLHTSF